MFYVSYNTIYDHVASGSYGKVRLKYSLFKRNEVCKTDITTSIEALPTDTALEIVNLGGYPDSLFANPKYLLESGISSLRIDGIEYKLIKNEGSTLIQKSPYSNKKSATLLVQSRPAKSTEYSKWEAYIDSNEFKYGDRKLTLISPDGKNVVFEQKWYREHSYKYCPEYLDIGTSPQQPIQLILDSFSI